MSLTGEICECGHDRVHHPFGGQCATICLCSAFRLKFTHPPTAAEAEVADLRIRLAAVEADCEQWRARYNADIGQIACSLDWGNTPPLDVLVKDIRARRAGVVALNERLAASEAERERLKRTCPHCGFESPSEVSTAHGLGNHAGCVAVPVGQLKQAEAALAAAQAENARLLRLLGEAHVDGWCSACPEQLGVPCRALALPADSAALREVCVRAAKAGFAQMRLDSSDAEVTALVARVLEGSR